MVLVDTHCHLGSRQYDGDRAEMVERMLDRGVTEAIIICCGRHDLLAGARLRAEHPGFKLACSIHPQDLEEDSSERRLAELRQVIEEYQPDVVGETGLDYHSHPHTKEQQKHFFHAQLAMAEEFDLPVNVHCRRAAGDLLEILKQHHCRGIIHSYSGSFEMAELYMKEGYYISFGASMLFAGAKKPAAVIARMPLDRLLLETDSPYQSPVRGTRHEPQDILRIYEAVSRIKGIPLPELAEAIAENFHHLFREG